MPRYVALLRGVSPMNCQMPVLQRCLEDAGFTHVKTLLSSGNVAFSTPRAASLPALQRRVEKAMQDGAGYGFMTVVRAAAQLQQLLDADPFAAFELPPGGNSITDAWARSFPTMFPGKPYVGRGISGQTTPQMLARFREFLREPEAVHEVELPISRDQASILQRIGGEVLCVYVPNAKGPAFMALLEKTFGKAITTRTLDTVARCARA